MEAERLIGLEAALRDLSALYPAARRFAALREAAETDLLPRLDALGAGLRRQLRRGTLTPESAGEAATEILATAAHWRSRLEEIRASAPYRDALAAVEADRQTELAVAIPKLLAALHLRHPAPALCFAVSATAPRRRAGDSPFVGVDELAARLAAAVRDGIAAESDGGEWWSVELAGIACAATPGELESPFCVRMEPAAVRLAVFESDDEPGLRVFAPRVRGPLIAVLAAEATDGWWEAYAGTYAQFRDAARSRIEALGIPARIEAAPRLDGGVDQN